MGSVKLGVRARNSIDAKMVFHHASEIGDSIFAQQLVDPRFHIDLGRVAGPNDHSPGVNEESSRQPQRRKKRQQN